MAFTIAFENYLVLEDAAKECTEQLKVKFQEFSKALQMDILVSRLGAVESSLNCSLTIRGKSALNWTNCLARAMQEVSRENMTMLSKATSNY